MFFVTNYPPSNQIGGSGLRAARFDPVVVVEQDNKSVLRALSSLATEKINYSKAVEVDIPSQKVSPLFETSTSAGPTSAAAAEDKRLEMIYEERRKKIRRVCRDIHLDGDYHHYNEDPTKIVRKNTMIFLSEEKVAYCAIPKVSTHV